MKYYKLIKCFRIFINIIAMVCLIAGIAFTAYGFMHLGSETDSEIVTYVIAFISFLVSIVALMVSLKTFFSIDAVNSITSMEGNVLQNENYSVSYPEFMKKLSVAVEEKEYTSQVMELMHADKKNTSTCIEYADWIQAVIDNLIWIAYIDKNDALYKSTRDRLIDSIDKEYVKYSKLSNGIQYTLGEHIKLIRNVLTYIEWSNHGEANGVMVSRLEDIRGRMIQNPVSGTVYYDYVGLTYHKKVKEIINSVIPELARDKATERTVQYYNCIMKHEFEQDDLIHINVLLDKAIEAFDKAKALSGNDLLWEGYILYNRIRVLLLGKVLRGENFEYSNEHILAELDRVCEIRENVKYLYTKEGSFIYNRFEMEINNAKELRKAAKEFFKM